MRVFLLSTLTVALFLGGAGVGTAQTKDKDKDKEKKAEWPTEIGGKTVDEWMEAIAQRDRAQSVAAMKTILMFGPKKSLKAVPIILEELKKHKPLEKKKVDASFVVTAPAVLYTIMSSQEKPDEKLTTEILGVLKGLLKDPQVTIRYRTLMAVVQFGPYIKEAIPELIERVKDLDTWEIRFAAVNALSNYPLDRSKKEKEVPPEEVGNVLKYALKDSSSQVRLAALHAIDNLNLPDHPKTKVGTETAITQLLATETDPSVRITAYFVIYDITKNKNGDRRKAIASYLKHKETAVRVEAIQALGKIGADAEDQKFKLAECLAEKDGKGVTQDAAVRVAAFQALSQIGHDNPQIAKMIADYTSTDHKPAVRATALLALSNTAKGAKPFVRRMAGFADDPKEDMDVRVAAVQALANLGAVAKDQVEVITPLVSAKGEKEQPLRLAAIQALAALEPGSPATLNLLSGCLKDKDVNVVSSAVLALGRMEKKEALPFLREVIANKDHPAQLRQEAQQASDHIVEANKKTTKKGEKG